MQLCKNVLDFFFDEGFFFVLICGKRYSNNHLLQLRYIEEHATL